MNRREMQSISRETLEDFQFHFDLSSAEMAEMLRREMALLEFLAFTANPSEGEEI